MEQNKNSLRGLEDRRKSDDISLQYTATYDILFRIIDLELNDLRLNLKERNVSLRISPTAKKLLLEDGSHMEWGARPIRRVIQNKIESEISLRFLDGQFIENGGTITISGKNTELIFKQLPIKTSKKTTKKAS